MMPQGATIVAITGATLGQVARLEIPASGNQSLVGIWAEDPGLNDWLYVAVQRQIVELIKSATGAAQQHVNKRDVDSLKVPLVSATQVDAWGAIARPLFDRAATADRESLELIGVRNALLPLLMSGKLRVKDAGKIAEEVL